MAMPVSTPQSPPESPDDLSNRAERRIIGTIGLVLPLLLYLIAAWRPQDPSMRWRLLPSISAYYYTGSVAVFVGLLASLGVFLFAYQGYANRWHMLDIIAARTAAVAALFVGFFPTGTPRGYTDFPWWQPWMEALHDIGATVLFCSFAFFALYLFRRTDATGAARTPDKRWRDAVYLVCGIAIVAAIAWAATIGWLNQRVVNGISNRPIFWPECLALVFFAISWLVKGRVDQTMSKVTRQAQGWASPPAGEDSVNGGVRGQ
jgi:uncharacterized membrane protein